MDYIRSSYRTRIRPYRNSDREVEIVWYFTDPNAPILPYWTPFRSRNWTDRGEEQSLGETTDPTRWSNGANLWGPPVAAPLGPQDWWENGIPADQECKVETWDWNIAVSCDLVALPVSGDVSGELAAGLEVRGGGNVGNQVAGAMYGNLAAVLVGAQVGNVGNFVGGALAGKLPPDLTWAGGGNVGNYWAGRMAGTVTPIIGLDGQATNIPVVSGSLQGSFGWELSGKASGDNSGGLFGGGSSSGALSGQLAPGLQGSVSTSTSGGGGGGGAVSGDLSGQVAPGLEGAASGDVSGGLFGGGSSSGALSGQLAPGLAGAVTTSTSGGGGGGSPSGDLSGQLAPGLTGSLS